MSDDTEEIISLKRSYLTHLILMSCLKLKR